MNAPIYPSTHYPHKIPGVDMAEPPSDPVYRKILTLQQPELLPRLLKKAWRLKPGRRVSTINLRQIHYKPYHHARLVADVAVVPQCNLEAPMVQPIFINVYATAERARKKYLSAEQQRAHPSLGSPVVLLEDAQAVVWSLPNEPKLGTIQFCFDPTQFAHFLTEHDLGTADSTTYLPQLVRYVPRHRALFRVAPTGSRPALYLKVYKQGQDSNAAANLRMLTEAAALGNLGFSAPRLVTYSPQLRTVAMTEVAGMRLTELLPATTPELFAEVGRALAAFHGSDLNPAEVWTAEQEVRALTLAMADVKAAQPILMSAMEQVLERITILKDSLDFCKTTPIHANLFGDQILCDSQRIGIVDWDDLAWGDPLFDVGRLIAHMIYAARASRLWPAYLVGLISALLNGYARNARQPVDAQRLRWHIAVALLLRAKISALRAVPATWIEDLRWSLAEAQHVLNGKSKWLPR